MSGILGPTNSILSPQQPQQPEDDQREFGDPLRTRRFIFDRVLKSAQNLKPVTNSRHTLRLSGVDYVDKDHISLADQKQAILAGKTLGRRLRGTWELVDNATGTVLDSKQQTIARVPYLTQRGTFINNGNEYTLINQARLRPGVFTRVKDNGEIESHVNAKVGTGPSHRYFLDPEKNIFAMRIGQAKIPVMPLLKAMGATDRQLQEAWGNEIWNANAQQNNPGALNKLYQRLVRKRDDAAEPESKQKAIAEAMLKMELDPHVTHKTLGQGYTKVDLDTILTITKKLLAVSRGEQEVDDRDHLAFQTIMGPEDLLSERLEKDYGGMQRDLLRKASFKGNLGGVPTSALTKQLESVLISSGLGSNLEEINTAELLDKQGRITRMGEGGIPSSDSVPDEARSVQPSHFGFLDSVRTPENMNVGVDLYLSSVAKKGQDGKIYIPLRDTRTGKIVNKSPQDLVDSAVAFPGELKRKTKRVGAMKGGVLGFVPRDQIQYELPNFESAFSPLGNLVPMKSGMKAQRMAMAGRMLSQALPLEQPEAPLVRSGVPGSDDDSYEAQYGKHMGIVRADRPGRVVSVSPGSMKVKYDDGETADIELYEHFAFNRKSSLHNTPMVKPGDVFKPGQLLAKSNYTDDEGVTALGKNLKTGYVAMKGYNFEDAIVLSESAAKKLTSEHMYQHGVDKSDSLKTSKRDFISLFPAKFNKATLEKMDDDGVILPGTVVNYGDPLILAARQRDDAKNKIHKKGSSSFSDVTDKWEHHTPGIVTDVYKGPKGTTAFVKSYVPMAVADKLSNRYGGKGVISAILPDDEMPRTADGQPIEVALNPLGIISRVNPSQIVETALGKIAAKTGKPYNIQDFESIEDLVEFAEKELQKHGMTDLEDVVDPETDTKIPQVLVGNQFFMKLHHTSESKMQGRSTGGYTADESPAKGGGGDSSKRLALLDLNALLSHGATQTIRDSASVRGQKNEDYWLSFMRGVTPPEPKIPMVYEKFVNYLKGSGINVVREGTNINIMALTDADVSHLASTRFLQNGETVKFDKNLEPVKGGLFDPTLTGGNNGCFHPDVKVWTEFGMLPIGKIVKQKLALRVWTYNHVTSQFELKPITNWFTHDSPNGVGCGRFDCKASLAGTLGCRSASTLRGTPEHQVYDINGNKRDLAKADYLMAVVERLSNSQTQLLYGSLLGDLSVTPGGQVTAMHGIKQAAYCEWKASILRPFITAPLSDFIDTSDGHVRRKLRFSTRTFYEAYKARQLCYINGKKTVTQEWLDKITEMGLAVWLADDAHVNRHSKNNSVRISISTHSFSKHEIELLQNWLAERWNIRATYRQAKKYVGRDMGYLLEICGKHALRLLELTVPYWNEGVAYKVPAAPKNTKCRRCGAEINRRRRVCHECMRQEAVSVGTHKFPRHIFRLIGPSATVRQLLSEGRWPEDEQLATDEWVSIAESVGSMVAEVENDTELRYELEPIPFSYSSEIDSHGARTKKVYDIEVADNHNYFANGMLVSNSRWSAVKLHQPLPNPVMEEPIRKILGLTQKKFDDIVAGKERTQWGTGPSAISKALQSINLDKELEVARAQIASGKKTYRDEAVRKLGYLKSAKELGIHPKDWVLSAVPVLPPRFRPVSTMTDKKLPLVSDPNYLYKELMEANSNWKEMSDITDDVGDEQKAAYDAFKAVTGLGDPVHPKLVEKNVQGLLRTVFGSSPKFGVVQRRLLSTPVDVVGRAVIAPNPELDMDQVALPEDKAWNLYKPFVVRRLKRRGLPVVEALKQVENRSELARNEMVAEMGHRPVIINRAPVLHRFGIMAFWPQLTKHNTMEISPLVVKGFNADFDGDQMNFQVPVKDEARQEAIDRLLPSANLLSPGDFKSPVHAPSQEYVGGLYAASAFKANKKPRTFRSIRDLKAAVMRGEVGFTDPVEVLE
jgi:DNA-directed RNA polymerase subunit beta